MELWIALMFGIFIVTLVLALSEKFDKAEITILGAIATYINLAVFTGATLEDVLSFIEWPTIIIMFSVLVTGLLINEAGLFQWIAIKLVKLTEGDFKKIFFSLIMLTILLSSVVTILVAAIIIGRLTISITDALDVDPYPYLISEAVAVGIGGATSMVASPNAILISDFAKLDFVFFMVYTFPFSVIVGLITSLLLIKIIGNLGEVSELRKTVLMEFEEWSVVPDIKMFYLSAIMLSAMIIGFIIFPAYLVALFIAIIYLLIRKKPLNEIAEDLEWGDLFFFIGIFIIVGGVEHTEILQEIGNALGTISAGNPLIPIVLIMWITGLSSGFLDGVTIVLTFMPIIDQLVKSGGFSNLFPLFMIVLVLSTNFGGSMTPIGTPASLLIVSLASSKGVHISFKNFIKLGAIIVFLNLALATVYVIGLSFIF